jgi:hypothetical protein
MVSSYTNGPCLELPANKLAPYLILFYRMRSKSERAQRKPVVLAGRVTWKDARGMTRFASVMTRNISDTGVFIEWREPTSIPLYRLVSFQLERDARNAGNVDALPPALRAGKVLSAVYRLGTFQRSTGTPDGYGLRLLVEPARVHVSAEPIEATA